MKIRISYEGHLYLQRGGSMQQQTCPHKNLPCGDWCPLFGEPHDWEGRQAINLCMNFLQGEITDERGTK